MGMKRWDRSMQRITDLMKVGHPQTIARLEVGTVSVDGGPAIPLRVTITRPFA